MSKIEINTEQPILVKAKASASFINVGERTNVTGSAMFKRLILDDDYEKALDVALKISPRCARGCEKNRFPMVGGIN